MTAAAKTACVPSIVPRRRDAFRAALALALVAGLFSAAEAATPRIRTSDSNVVPACVTPQRLMAYLKQRNPKLAPRFANIADWYKRHGETWRVRWDYAFFQMAVETNFLTFKRGDGSWGDAKPKQNNFAGLGTTGGGVPGDSYPNVGTGVLAQIQHLVVYSGEHIPKPIGPRTALKQDVIIEATGSKKGRMTFADLAGRWAADKHYGAAIEWVAGRYRQQYCTGRSNIEAKAPPAPPKRMAGATALGGPAIVVADASNKKSAPVRTIWSRGTQPSKPAKPSIPEVPVKAADTIAREEPTPTAAPAQEPLQITLDDAEPETTAAAATVGTASGTSNLQAFAFAGRLKVAAASSTAPAAATTGTCSVIAASYGGDKTLLVRGPEGSSEIRYTVLTVLAGFERSMLDSYIKTHAPGGASLGEFESKDAAIAKARELCPSAQQTTTRRENATQAG